MMKRPQWKKRILSTLLAASMMLSSVPTTAFAVDTADGGLCAHHTEHTAECHYAEAVEGQPCTHIHSEDCYAILECLHTCGDECADGCAHECTVESGCITMELDCHHTHGDCGYAEAVAPQDCTICQSVLTHAENCGYVAPVAEVTCACVPGEDGTLVHTEGCGYVAPVEEVKCACEPTVTHGGEGCTYAEGKAGSPCTHTHAVKVDSADSCYKLLCSHKDGGHDDACGYVAAVEAHECHYECAECAAAPASEEPSEESSEPTPVCTCAEVCTAESFNEYCDVCGVDYSKCTGTDTAAAYADGDDLAISGAWMSSNTPYLASGSKEASATQPETGGYAYWDAASNTLTLNNFTSATDAATGIFYDGSAVTLRIELVGNNSVTGGTGTAAHSGVRLFNTNTNIIFSGGGSLTATGTGSGYGVDATGGNITVDSGTTLVATGGSSGTGVDAEAGSIIVNAGGSLTGNGGSLTSNGVNAGSITVNGGSLTATANGGSYGVNITSSGSLTVSDDSHIVAIGGSNNNIPLGGLPDDYYYSSGDSTTQTFTHSTDTSLTGTVTEKYFELVTAQHLSDTYTSNGDATHSRYCSCALHTKVIASEACSGGTATCTTQANCEHCGASYGEVDLTNHDENAEYENGFCPNCDAYEPATDSNSDGVYEIGNAGELFWFAQQVNIAGNTTANAMLTADIDLENRTWYPIGVYNDAVDASGATVQVMFKGTLDGCGHTVSNFTATGTGSQGLVGYSDTTVVVKNLGVINATVSGWNAGAVLAYKGTVENCYAIDCKVTGYTTAADSVGVYAGAVTGSQSPTVKNCFAYNCEVIAGAGMESKARLAPVGGSSVSNSYYVNVTATNGTLRTHSGEMAKTAEQFASGEVAYLLQGEQTEQVWGQTIGTNTYPVIGGAAVYYGYTSCAEDAEMVYTNDSSVSAEKPGHTHGTPSYSWSEDPITPLTVSVSCTACGETFTGSTTDMDVTTSEDGLTTTYTATVTLDGKDYTDSKTVSNEVASVNITWGSMDFTYTDESGWNTPDTAWVQVENTGNTSVSVTYTYDTERTDITGSFFDGISTVTAPVAIDAESEKKIWLRLDGKPSEALNNTTIGSVKLTIE